MLKIWTITWLHLKEFFKSPGAIVLMFVMPCLFSWIFGGIAIQSEQTKPAVSVVAAEDDISTEIYQLLIRNKNFQWEKETKQQAKENVAEQDSVAAVVIPDNIDEVIVKKEPLFDIIIRSKTQDYMALEPYLQGTANTILQSYDAVKDIDDEAFPALMSAISTSEGVLVEQQILQKDSNNLVQINLMFVGFTIMFMMFGLSGAASTILDERSGGTWERLMVTPASKLQIILGYLFAYFLMGWVQFIVLMSALKFLFDTNWGKLTYLIPFASLVILTVVSFGLMIAGLVKTKQQAGAISTILIVSTCMLGGVYWSIDFVPEFMQKLALGVPQSWAMSGFKEIISGGLHSMTLAKDCIALLLFTILFLAIGLRGITYK
ncbi:ABC transporter permease [Bacillus sp. MRMR6]|uniref:ABC transporter permease n=1 Tax=Bacillus sp. MRMR6 TaxID=1928617 RepID=UPI0009517BBF|nr:ABC transporter permease [Bacillus sp. MRMR6]OLS37260.1 ABC transporter [Bacillus sp. MRMR6]